MHLVEMLKGDGNLVKGIAEAGECHIAGLTCDSRKVEPGFLFAAMQGTKMDGRNFIQEAIKRGAAAILGPVGSKVESQYAEIPFITDEDPRRLYAVLAARFFEEQPETIAAITGTSGKTSVCQFLRQIWNLAGLRAATLGTLGLQVTLSTGELILSQDDTGLTTPDPAYLHGQLRAASELGVQHLAMEASSHGLDQRRLDGVRVSAAAFTNLSRDHLDYHKTEEGYFFAKLRLFEDLLEDSGTAVINADESYAEHIASVCQKRCLSVLYYGNNGDRVRLVKLSSKNGGQLMTINIDGRLYHAHIPLVGNFQASNVLCAASLALAIGIETDVLISALERLQGVPGRMELIGNNSSGGCVYVDYAHKPDALKHALQALRQHTVGKLIVLFGCGGERDHEKRPEMGRLASELADKVFITDDNPRGERPADIRRAINAGCPDAVVIADRRDAIAAATAMLGRGDVLLVAGKGHESVQVIGDQTIPFDDSEVVRNLIRGGI